MSKESICQIYLEEIRIKVEHQGEHAAFFNLDKTIEEKTFYELFDKKRLLSFFNCKNVSNRKQYASKYFLFSNQR